MVSGGCLALWVRGLAMWGVSSNAEGFLHWG